MKKTFYFFIALVVQSISSNGQLFQQKYYHDDCYKFDDTVKVMVHELFSTYKSEFSLNEKTDMVQISEQIIDTVGTVNSRYRQYYMGYPIEATMVNVISKYGVALFVNGFMLQNFTKKITTTPIDEANALNSVLRKINAQKYKWQDSLSEIFIKHYSDVSTGDSLYDSTRTYYPKGELVIAHIAGDTCIHDASKYKLCWKFYIEPLKWDTVLIDTNTVDTIVHMAYIPMYVPADPLNVYIDAENGNVFTIDTQGYSSGFWVTCGFDPIYYMGFQEGQMYKKTIGNYKARDARGFTLYFIDHNIGSSIPIFQTNGSIIWTERKNVLTPYWGLQKSWDYFSDIHGYTDGPEWNRREARILVNYKTSGVTRHPFRFVPDRYWDEYRIGGESSVLGHESAAELDVTAHEYTHAMIHYGTHLDDYNDAGAILEGFCNYFGTLIAANKFPSRYAGNWNYGFGYNTGEFARNFFNPSADYPLPSSSNYRDAYFGGDTYRSSGVFRKWLSLMTNGSSSLGFAPAPRVERDAFITMQWWIWSNLNFPQFRNQCLAEYEYYYGKCSPAWQSCYKAWAAVGIGSVSSLFCRRLTITTDHVGGVGMATRLRMIPTNNDDLPLVLSYKWVVPSAWSISYSQDSSEISIDSTFDNTSKFAQCIVTYNDYTKDTFSTYMHFINQSVSKSTPPSIASKHLPTSVEIFPNPATNKLNIIFNDLSIGNVEFILHDLSGRELFSKMLSSPKNSLLLPKLTSGLYFAETKLGNQSVMTRLVIQ